MSRRFLLAFVVALSPWAAACGLHMVPVAECPILAPPVHTEGTMRVRYLGVGGFLLEYDDAVVVTAPLYSNPGLIEVGFDHAIRPDGRRIDALFPEEGRRAQAILVGHAHYDHLLDVPHVALNLAKDAQIYGSDTMVTLIRVAAPELAGRVHSLEKVAGDAERPGTWIRVSDRVRLMAFKSEHSLQATLGIPIPFTPKLPLHLWRGDADPATTTRPRSASDWPQGEVLAYLIDFLADDGSTAFRVYFQDSAARPPAGHLPRTLVEARQVDLALLCASGSLPSLPLHPRAILENVRPRFVLLGHWEDFFVAQDVDVQLDGKVQELPTKHTRELLKRVANAGYRDRAWLPCPTRSEFEFPARTTRAEPESH